jgi:hypothetical protein
MNASTYIVAFHIGRGGRFHNQGHKSFMPHIKQLSDCFSERCIIFREDEEGNPLPDEKWLLIDGGGNVILEGRANIESKTGVLDWDGEYDTDIVQYLSECDDDELRLILDAYGRGEVSADIIPAVMEVWPYDLEIMDENCDCIFISNDKDKLIQTALSEEDCYLQAYGVDIWESKHGEEALKRILANY